VLQISGAWRLAIVAVEQPKTELTFLILSGGLYSRKIRRAAAKRTPSGFSGLLT